MLTIWIDSNNLVIALLNGFQDWVEDVAAVSLSKVFVFFFDVDDVEIAFVIDGDASRRLHSLEFRIVTSAADSPEDLRG